MRRHINRFTTGGGASMLVGVGMWIQQGGLTRPAPTPLWYWVGLALMGLGVGVGIYGWLRKPPVTEAVTSPLEDVKSDLVVMNKWEREAATKQAGQQIPRQVVMQIHDDCVALWGNDMSIFTLTLIQKVISNHDIDALIGFFKQLGDILDSNGYGLKVELEDCETHKSSQLDLAQKRLKLQMGRKRKAIIQKNIDRVRSLSYGLNSSILLRDVLDRIPESKGIIPAQIKVALAGIETAADKTLNTMLNDLENEWRVTRP